jgi:hypothetical protein
MIHVGLVMAFGLFPMEAFAQKVATLDKVTGDVKVFTQGKARELKGRDGMALFATHIIKTGPDSTADIVFETNSIVRVTPNTELALSTVNVGKDKSNININLTAGKVFNVVNKLTLGSTYVVQTTTATSGVKGTIYSAETNGTETVFMVKEGQVEAASPSSPDKPVVVADLTKTVVVAGKLPSAPVPLTPEEIALFSVIEDIGAQIKKDLERQIREQVQQNIFINPRIK